MIKNNNNISADKGKYLLYKGTTLTSLNLGKFYVCKDGKVTLEDIKEEDVKEVLPVLVQNTLYYVEATTYPEIVTELIRKKYSLDLELAMIANSRLDSDFDDSEFQSWRKLCKLAAKTLVNE